MQVVKSYPKLEVPEGITDEAEVVEWWRKEWSRDRDVLHQIDWYRVGRCTLRRCDRAWDADYSSSSA